MPRIYRSMLEENGKPMTEQGANRLGVRVHTENPDVIPDANGFLYPGGGGMSVVPSPRRLLPHQIPERLLAIFPNARGKKPNLRVWKMETGPFAAGSVADHLSLRLESSLHGVVEPSEQMLLESYETALAATRDAWVIDETGTIDNG